MSGQKRPADADPSEEPASKRQVRFTEPAADPDAEQTDDEDGELPSKSGDRTPPFHRPVSDAVLSGVACRRRGRRSGSRGRRHARQADSLAYVSSVPHHCAACNQFALSMGCPALAVAVQADDEPSDSGAAEPVRGVQAVVVEQAQHEAGMRMEDIETPPSWLGGPGCGMTKAVRWQCSATSCAVQLQQTAVGQQVHTNLVIAMCGIAKVFVGELIETGVRTELQKLLGVSRDPCDSATHSPPRFRPLATIALLLVAIATCNARSKQGTADAMRCAACSPDHSRGPGRRRTPEAVALGGCVPGARQGWPSAAPPARQAVAAVTGSQSASSFLLGSTA